MGRESKSSTKRLLLTLLVAFAIAAMGWALACDGGQPEGATTGSSSETAGPGDSRTTSFATDDGVTLGGHLFGTGTSGVVLAHMRPADQTSWYPTAERLADEGYLVLTFDFRGYGDSEGDKQLDLIDRDVAAAIREIGDAGAAEVTLVGASMGGTASLVAAGETPTAVPVVGVATLSAPSEFEGLSAAEAVPGLTVPLLFIAAEDDRYAEDARELQQLASNQGQLELFPGDEHGTDLLEGPHGEEVWELLSGFLQQVMP